MCAKLLSFGLFVRGEKGVVLRFRVVVYYVQKTTTGRGIGMVGGGHGQAGPACLHVWQGPNSVPQRVCMVVDEANQNQKQKTKRPCNKFVSLRGVA